MASQRRASVRSKVGMTLMVSLLGVSCAAPIGNWPASYDSNTGARFIPVELWTGAEWDGKRVITLSKADLEFGPANAKNITGPFEWTRPETGETLLVYERNNGRQTSVIHRHQRWYWARTRLRLPVRPRLRQRSQIPSRVLEAR